MLYSYLKIAFRNLQRNKVYALINMSGLAIGIGACLLIYLVVRYETSFDQFHAKKDFIYRVGTEFHTQDGVTYSGGASFPVGPALRANYPQIRHITSMFRWGSNQITIDNGKNEASKKLMESGLFFIEPEFFNIFDYAWISGDPKSSLAEPNSAVLTQETAEKYFGDWKSAIGRTFIHNNKYTYKVTGILKNFPPNTDFPMHAMVSYSTLKNTPIGRNMNDWVSTFGQASVYLILPSEISFRKFNSILAALARKNKPAEYAKDIYVAQPLSEIHYDDRFGNYGGHVFSHSLITAMMLIGIFILTIACVNFINLATAQAVNRSREVGIRKVLGTVRRQLIFQFLCETGIITLVAILIATGIAKLSLPLLNQLLESKLKMNPLADPGIIGFLFILCLLVTLFSGLYPAIILSGFNPVNALKNKISSKTIGGITLRRGLVILQFVIAQILIIGMIVVVSQMNYFRNASLGFDRAQVANVSLPGDSVSRTKYEYLKTELLSNPDIVNLSLSMASPASSETDWNSDFKFDHAEKNTNFSANLKWADEDYFKTYGLHFLAGRPYYKNDTVKEFVVNETLLHKVGITDPWQAIGKQINFWDGNKVGPIVGVIRDFNAYSLREPMAPVILSTWKDVYQTMNIKIKPGSSAKVLPIIEKSWTEAFPDYVYQFKFLDDSINNFYKQENQLSQLYKIFAGIAIFISCLGLYGLVSFMAVKRTKEVGIRKVLGATAANIVYLLSREFTLLIMLAFVISAPIAYFILKHWLQNYAYRIELGISVFLISILGSVAIAWLTVAYKAISAATANPVKSLRTE
jgi:predicted permease